MIITRNYYVKNITYLKQSRAHKFIRNINDDEDTVTFYETDFAFCDIKDIPWEMLEMSILLFHRPMSYMFKNLSNDIFNRHCFLWNIMVFMKRTRNGHFALCQSTELHVLKLIQRLFQNAFLFVKYNNILGEVLEMAILLFHRELSYTF